MHTTTPGGPVVNLHRLTPISPSRSPRYYGGRCSACERPLHANDRIAHLYGEAFHFDCAFYRHNGTRPAASVRGTS
jgi:hypothetical protein